MMRKFSIQQGMTLIELMVSMVIGMFLILGAVTVYTQGRQNYQANEAVARLQENVRFSMSVMEPDIQLVGHWGLNNMGVDPASITVAVSCDGTDVSDWALDVLNGVTAVDNIQAADADEVADNCPAFGGGIVVDTDMLVLRHASGKEEVFNDGSIQVQSSHAESHLIDDGAMHPQHADLIDGTTTQTYDLNVNAWYVSEDSNAMEGVPSLRRRTLIGDEMIDEEVIAGVENMQIQFGIDTDTDDTEPSYGSVDRYVDAEDVALDGDVKIISVRLWLLIRSTEEERGFAAGKAGDWDGYVPLDAALDPIIPDDKFRRFQASKTIFLRNFQRVKTSG